MAKIIACIDGSVYSTSVADHAGWAAARIDASVELLQVLGRRDAASQDRSGRIIAGARRQLLAELAELDAERARLLQQQSWLDLEEATQRLKDAGVAEVAPALRHGDFLETLAEREAGADLIVMGKRGAAADFAQLHLGSNLERVLRASSLPVLVASRAFKPIKRFMIAFDGRPSALKAVDQVSRTPHLAGLEAVLITAAAPSPAIEAQLEAAASQIRAGGLAVTTRIAPGPAITAIPQAVAEEGIDLLVMGAYGHSRLRTLMIGSTTSEMIRQCLIPILVYR